YQLGCADRSHAGARDRTGGHAWYVVDQQQVTFDLVDPSRPLPGESTSILLYERLDRAKFAFDDYAVDVAFDDPDAEDAIFHCLRRNDGLGENVAFRTVCGLNGRCDLEQASERNGPAQIRFVKAPQSVLV